MQALDPSNGDTLWTDQFGTTEGDFAGSVAVHTDGSIIVGGWTQGNLEGPFAGGDSDGFVRKENPDGTHAWTHQIGTSQTGREAVAAVAFDATGNVIIAVYTSGDLEDPFAGGSSDGFVRKLDPNGLPLWTRQIGSGETDRVRAAAIDADGNVIVAGYTKGVLGGASHGGRDAFVRNFDADGQILWTAQIGSPEFDEAQGVAIDSQGSVIIAGQTAGNLEGMLSGERDAFVQKLDADGNHVWTHQFGRAYRDDVTAVTVDETGNIIVVGYTKGDLEGALAGDRDTFVRKLDIDGVPLWTDQFGTDDGEQANGVTTDSDSNVIVVGKTRGKLGQAHYGTYDIFARKYTP